VTKAKSFKRMNLPACWKVRVYMRGGGVIHLVAKTEPAKTENDDGQIVHVEADWIKNTNHGDTIAFIDWTEASALTWRYTGPKDEDNPSL